jgi:hypothetical protein
VGNFLTSCKDWSTSQEGLCPMEYIYVYIYIYVCIYIYIYVYMCLCVYSLEPRLRSRYNNSLRAGRSGDRIPIGMIFSAPVRTGPGAYQASYTMGTGPFPGVKRLGRGVDHPPPPKTEVKERVELYLYPVQGFRGLFYGKLLNFSIYSLYIRAT